ncbi:MAG: division/cell wall cluster transcriptional repressor MraZ, partial [Nitrospinota bacterium]|nr:division/cell wall cluster transcriptional repressor MraZ [Nitrospinota bacterium]
DIFATSVLSDSVNLLFDGEGRISIPEKLLEHAKIKQTMLFVGQGKIFQIWEPKLFEKFKTQARKKANLNRASLKWETQFSKEGR